MNRLVELADRYVRPMSQRPDWCVTDCYFGPENVDTALASLLEEFCEKDLLAAGIVSVADGEAVRLRPELARQAGPIIVLRATRDGRLKDLLTRRSKSLANKLPLVSVLADSWTLESMQKRDGMIFLCPAVEHVAEFRAMGIPASSLSGIKDLKRKGLRELQGAIAKAKPCKVQKKKRRRMIGTRTDGTSIEIADPLYLVGPPEEENLDVANHLRGDYEAIDFEKEANKNDDDASCHGVTIVLADWHPRGLSADEIAQVRETAAFFAGAKRLLNLDVANVLVWSPTKQERNDVGFVLRHGGREDLWRVVRESVESSNYTPALFAKSDFQPRHPVEHFGDAFLGLQQFYTSDQGHLEDDVLQSKLTADYHESVRRDLVAPLLQLAFEVKDPLMRAMLALVAENCSLFFWQSPAMLRLWSADLQGDGASTDNESLLKQSEQRLRMAAKINRQIKEIRK